MGWSNSGWESDQGGWYKNAVVASGVTLDPVNIDPGYTLSAGNLKVTGNGSALGVARSTTSHTTGKYYWEVTLGTCSNTIVGACSSTQVLTQYLSQTNSGMGNQSGWLTSGTGTLTGPANVSGHTYGVAMDIGNGEMWIIDITGGSGQWNSNASANPATNTNGAGFPTGMTGGAALFAAITVAGSGDNGTFNFGNSAYAGTPPSGFSNW